MKATTQDRAVCGVNDAPVRRKTSFRPMEGRDVIPRMESMSESGSNRFAALDDPETVPAGTQELEVVGFIRERSSFAGDCD